MSQMTERQARDWPGAVAEVRLHLPDSAVSEDFSHRDWIVSWEEEFRPARGHAMSAVWVDGEYIAQVSMDVYGSPRVSTGMIAWEHLSDYEECECEPCTAEREPTDSRTEGESK